MRVWWKKPKEESSNSSVARAALAGASREELSREALRTLTQNVHADRIGVWLEPDSSTGSVKELSGAFHGLVRDRTSHDTPLEWRTLSLEPPLPEELLFGRKPVEQNLEALPAGAMIGPLLGLRRALWIPATTRNQVQGLILLGSKGKLLASHRELAESVAAELALALELQDQLRLSRTRNADLALVRRLLEHLPGVPSSESLLSNLVAGCVQQAADKDGPGAAFAMIGVLQDPGENSAPPSRVDFRWRSGDEGWTQSIASGPLAQVWRRALDARQVIGTDPPATWPQASVARIVAFPLEAQGQLHGALVVGLPDRATSLTNFDRLELRALLAATLLQWRIQKEQESQRALLQHALLDLISDPVLLLDDAGKITASSRGARELLQRVGRTAGAPSTSIPSVYFSDLFSGGDRIRLQSWLQQSLDVSASGNGAEQETPQAELQNGVSVRLRLAPRMPGQPIPVLLQAVPVVASERPPDHAEAELHSVLEWLEEGVVLFDSHENVRAMNTRFEQIAGLSTEEHGKIKTLEGLIACLQKQAAEPARFAERWRALAQGIEGGVREELQMVHPAPRILERAVRPVLDPIGRRLGRVEIYRDLTAQRVFHSKLLQTEKLAALGQMVSGIAHELSNPLTSILGYAQRLLRQDFSGRSEEARRIYQEAERAGTILRQLLLNARETIPERRLVSLNQIVMRAMELQRFSLAAEKIRVEIDLDPALPFVHADAGQLQQVLINLLSNARQALEQGPEGTIRLRTRRASLNRVLLEVEDNGPGIPQAIQARIFEPFFTTKPAGVGTGLGLSIVLGVVREHGGQVHFQQPPQGGARFQIELPAASERQKEETLSPVWREAQISFPEPEPIADANAAAPRPASFDSQKGIRVLVVEDEPTVARLIADVLEDEGMRVDMLLDGREALSQAARQSYDLVICDMKMPGLDGQHFYRSLERAGSQLRERFLFVTGDVMGAQTREFLEHNRLPHVAKPFRVEELTEKVRAVLQLQAGHEPSAAEVSRKNAARNG